MSEEPAPPVEQRVAETSKEESPVAALHGWLSRVSKHPLVVLYVFIFGVLVVVITLAGYVFDGWRFLHTEPNKEVRFILDLGPNGNSGPGRDVKLGIDQALDADSFPFQITYGYRNDQGDQALAKQFAQRASDNPNVIAVIGHLESSVMAATLPIYWNSELPVLMPVPTNPTLTDQTHANVLRMPPTDESQAREATDFVNSRAGVSRIAIIIDNDNAKYSQYLATQFRTNVRAARALKQSGPVIAYEATVTSGNFNRVLPDTLQHLKIDTIFFPGTAENAATLLEMFAASNYSPLVLTTDGVITRNFLRTLSAIPNELYVTFQEATPSSTSHGGSALPCADSLSKFELSFCPYGYDSVVLLKEILQRLSNQIGHRAPTRKELARYFDYLRKDKPEPEFGGTFNAYQFDERGNNTLAIFHVWKAGKNGKWQQVDPQ